MYRYKWLRRGDSKFCAEYNGKIYFFMNQENLDKFLSKPYLYADTLLPSKFPSHVALAENPVSTMEIADVLQFINSLPYLHLLNRSWIL